MPWRGWPNVRFSLPIAALMAVSPPIPGSARSRLTQRQQNLQALTLLRMRCYPKQTGGACRSRASQDRRRRGIGAHLDAGADRSHHGRPWTLSARPARP
jgi:hypothetical protein